VVTFKLFEMRGTEPFFLMYGFAHEWSGYKLTQDQERLMKQKKDRQLFFEIGRDLARGIKAGTKAIPSYIVIEQEVGHDAVR